MDIVKQITALLEKYDIEAKLQGTRFTCCVTSYVGKLNTADITFSETFFNGGVAIFKAIYAFEEKDLVELENFLKGGMNNVK